jgi:hypothetical protein
MDLVRPLDPRVNPAYLKLDLYCRGLRIDESCYVEQEGGRPLLRTRAGLGSGLELVLPEGLWTNAPVLEPFARDSPYELRPVPGGGHALWLDGEPCAPVRLAPRPSWYDRPTSKGRAMRLVGTLQGTYLGVYPAQVCNFWIAGPERPEKENCRFCSVGLNLGADDALEKSVDEVLEVVHAAWRESAITYVDFNTGHHDAYDYLDVLEPYVRRVKRETGLLVGVQSPPHPDLSRYDRLRALGVNRVSFCFELFDPEHFARVCPGKARVYGLDRYLAAVEYCAGLGSAPSPPFEPWVANGEIIAGLEPPESSIAAIRWMTGLGAIPTVCVFRPLRGTAMASTPPPRTEDLVPVFEALYVSCMENRLPIGLAPNIHVSLVLLPEECRLLVQDEETARHLRPRELLMAVERRAIAAAFRGRRALWGPRPRAVAAGRS